MDPVRSALFLTVCSMLLASCGSRTPAPEFPALANDFVYRSVAFSPVGASAQGLHMYNGEDLDRMLDNMDFRAIQQQRQYYNDIHRRLEGFSRAALSPEDRADYDIIESQIGLSLFDIDVAASWRHSPQTYVELIGNALYNPVLLDYAPREKRFGDIIARMQQIPQFVRVAERQLFNAPAIWTQVAKEENDGNIQLIDKTLRAAVPPAAKGDFETAAAPALDALRAFNTYLESELPRRRRDPAGARGPRSPGGDGDWRLGPQQYAIKFRLALATDRTPDEVLADAEKRLSQVRAEMLGLATPLHAAWFGGHGDHGQLSAGERVNTIVREVLDHIAAEHSTPAAYMEDAKKDLAEARAFAREKNLLTLPSNDNLEVIPTPEFERGIYGVGGFNPAPALEPGLGAFFWITPIPADWPKERIESKLREYNVFNLKLLVIHEAMPGHYVQFEFANAIQPAARRLLRSIYGNGPYIEGWAQYITQVMLDEGLLNHSPELRLQLLKQELRVDANAIIDIRMQTNRMTDDEAMKLMEQDTFQEREEAVAKLQRVKLSSAQLPTYFVGWRDWLRARDLAGGGKNLRDFHDRALREGAVPLPVLGSLLTGRSL